MIKYTSVRGNILKDGHIMFDFDIAKELNRKAFLEDSYSELIMAVARKFPDEERHETALRYINEAENQDSNIAAQSAEK